MIADTPLPTLKGRAELARLFRGIGVELGVAAGAFSEVILKRGSCKRLFCIDRWNDHHGLKEYRETAMRLATLGRDRCVPLRMSFAEASRLWPDWSLDFVYIDGYAHTGQEGGQTLEQWWPKLKVGGILSGHDYAPEWPATMAAVDAFASKHGLEVKVTARGSGADAYPSWWVVKGKGQGARDKGQEVTAAKAAAPSYPPGKVMEGSPVAPGERVILVGNGPSMMMRGDRGAWIDSFDQVVRFNWFAIRGFEEQVGTKTTLWSTFGRGSLPKDEDQRPQRAVFIHGDKVKSFAFPVAEAWGIPRAFFDAVREQLRSRSKVAAEKRKKELLPSSGLVVALWLLETHGVPHLTLAGFDHFSKKESGGHHYWLNQTFSQPQEHDGEAEAEWFAELEASGRVKRI